MEESLSKGFNIVEDENSFTIEPKGGVLEILQACYPESVIELNHMNIDYSKELFTLVVTSYNEKSNVYLNFAVHDDVVTSILIDQVEVYF